MTKTELAKALGCNVRTVAKWQDDGMPVAARGRGGRASQYDVEACQAWKAARDKAAAANGTTDVAQERARKERAQAKLAEQMFQARAKELLRREGVVRFWTKEIAAVKARLLAIPQATSDVAHRAAVKGGAAGIERVIREAIEQALRELSDPKRIAEV